MKRGVPLPLSTFDAERVELRVSLPPPGAYGAADHRLFRLSVNRWERLEFPIPADWRGGGLQLDPRCRFTLLEIVGIRIKSGVLGESLWEKLGRDLVAGVRVSAGMQVLSNQTRLRLLCTGENARITLPDMALPTAEVPLVFELGLRVRTELASIGHTLHEWVEEADTKRRDAMQRLDVAEAARTYHEGHAAALLGEVEGARADGDRRETALREQLASAHEASRALSTTLTAEVEEARTDSRRQVAALNEQLAAARAAARTHARTLSDEIETARVDSRQQVAALREQLDSAHEAARAHAQTLTAEIGVARAYGEQRAATLLAEVEALRLGGSRQVAALNEQLASANEAARKLAATLTSEIEAAREDGNRREAAARQQLADGQEAARALAATLTGEIEAARAHGDSRAAASAAEIEEARGRIRALEAARFDGDARIAASTLEIDEGRGKIERHEHQLLELREEKARRVQELEQSLDASNQLQAEMRAELAESRRLGEENRGRVRSMQRSLSWRMTLPWRVFGRLLTGRRPARK